MEAYREIIDGDKLSQIINLPKALRDSDVEVIVLPLEEKKKTKTKKAILKDLPIRSMGKVLTSLDRESIYSDER